MIQQDSAPPWLALGTVAGSVLFTLGWFVVAGMMRLLRSGMLAMGKKLVTETNTQMTEVAKRIGVTIKFVALANRRHRETLDTALERTAGAVSGGFEQGTTSQRNESIARLNWTRSNLAGFAVETGAEVSLNTLDYHLDLFVLGGGGTVVRISRSPWAFN